MNEGKEVATKKQKDEAVNILRQLMSNRGNVVNAYSQENVNTSRMVESENERTIENVLAEEIQKNEKKKRSHKDKLLKSVTWFLGLQFALFFALLAVIVVIVLVAHMVGNDFEIEYINAVFDLMEKYMMAIIVELISMLYFIVRNVFDTTIPDLAKKVVPESKKKNEEA